MATVWCVVVRVYPLSSDPECAVELLAFLFFFLFFALPIPLACHCGKCRIGRVMDTLNLPGGRRGPERETLTEKSHVRPGCGCITSHGPHFHRPVERCSCSCIATPAKLSM